MSLGFRGVWGFGFGCLYRALDLGFGLFAFWALGFWGLGLRLFGSCVHGFGFMGVGFGVWVSGVRGWSRAHMGGFSISGCFLGSLHKSAVLYG